MFTAGVTLVFGLIVELLPVLFWSGVLTTTVLFIIPVPLISTMKLKVAISPLAILPADQVKVRLPLT